MQKVQKLASWASSSLSSQGVDNNSTSFAGSSSSSLLPPMREERRSFSAVAIDNYRIVVFGGSGRLTNHTATELYDSRTNSWTILPDLPTPRYSLSAVFLRGKIYAMGGGVISSQVSKHVDILDVETMRWSVGTDLPFFAGGAAATVLLDRYIYLSGGMSRMSGTTRQALFDVEHGKWEVLRQQMAQVRVGHNAVAVDDTVYLIGGSKVSAPFTVAPTMESFNIRTRSISSQLPSPYFIKSGRAAVVIGRKIYALGGSDGIRSAYGVSGHAYYRSAVMAGNGCIDNVEVFDVDSGKWTILAGRMSIPRAVFQAVVLDNTIYAIGGDRVVSNTVEKLDVRGLGAATVAQPSTPPQATPSFSEAFADSLRISRDDSAHPRWNAISFAQLSEVETRAKNFYKSDYSAKTMRDINRDFIKPTCTRTGTSFARSHNRDGLASDAFITHCWDEPFHEFVNSIRDAFKSTLIKPNLWICAFALRQGDASLIQEELKHDSALEDSPFVMALRESEKFVVVRNSVTDLYSRIWCVAELVFAEKYNKFNVADKAVVTGDNSRFANEETSCLDAKSFNKDDKAKILSHLLSEEGGYTKIDSLISQLRKF